jgi:hypothetical protein
VAEQKCPQCKGDMVGPISIDVPGAGMAGEVYLKVMPTSGMVKKPTRTQVRGLLCTECGNVELRADPTEIAQRWADGAR